jgi:hypothetical protein
MHVGNSGNRNSIDIYLAPTLCQIILMERLIRIGPSSQGFTIWLAILVSYGNIGK